jgi:hypothetical protein
MLTPQDTENFLLRQAAYQNGPASCLWRRAEGVQAALTKVDKSPGYSRSLKQLDEAVNRVTLTNTTEIQASPWSKFNSAVGG